MTIQSDGLGFHTTDSSYRKYSEGTGHSWYYLKDKCSSKRIKLYYMLATNNFGLKAELNLLKCSSITKMKLTLPIVQNIFRTGYMKIYREKAIFS